MENGHEIWHMGCTEPVCVRVTYNSSQGINKVQIRISRSTRVQVKQRGHCKSRRLYSFYGKGNKIHPLRRGVFFFFFHHKIVSAVKRPEFVSDTDIDILFTFHESTITINRI